jgi:hypothetical protein
MNWRQFSTNKHKWPIKCIKKCLTSVAVKEMQIKTTLRFHLIPVRMAIIKKTTTNAGGNTEGREEKDPLYSVDRNVN